MGVTNDGVHHNEDSILGANHEPMSLRLLPFLKEPLCKDHAECVEMPISSHSAISVVPLC